LCKKNQYNNVIRTKIDKIRNELHDVDAIKTDGNRGKPVGLNAKKGEVVFGTVSARLEIGGHHSCGAPKQTPGE
jgi:hypothetical protein